MFSVNSQTISLFTIGSTGQVLIPTSTFRLEEINVTLSQVGGALAVFDGTSKFYIDHITADSQSRLLSHVSTSTPLIAQCIGCTSSTVGFVSITYTPYDTRVGTNLEQMTFLIEILALFFIAGFLIFKVMKK